MNADGPGLFHLDPNKPIPHGVWHYPDEPMTTLYLLGLLMHNSVGTDLRLEHISIDETQAEFGAFMLEGNRIIFAERGF